MNQKTLEDLLSDTESPIERELLTAIYDEVTEKTSCIISVQTPFGGGRYRADISISRGSFCLVIECDGAEFHTFSLTQVDADHERDRECQIDGRHIFRFSGEEIRKYTMWCAAEVMRFLHSRGLTVGGYSPPKNKKPKLIRPDDDNGALTAPSLMLSALTVESREGRTTTHYEIDNDTGGGFCPGDVWVVGARTGWGKSSFAIACTMENIKQGGRSLIVSSEDSPRRYGERMIVSRALT